MEETFSIKHLKCLSLEGGIWGEEGNYLFSIPVENYQGQHREVCQRWNSCTSFLVSYTWIQTYHFFGHVI